MYILEEISHNKYYVTISIFCIRSIRLICWSPVFHGIDSRRINAAVPKQIGQPNDIFFNLIESSRKKMSQVMREYFSGCHIRSSA